MKTKLFFIYMLSFFIIVASVVFVNNIFAQNRTDIADVQYPIEELGSCQSREDCRSYCDKPANANACLNFAKENNLMSQNEIAMAEKFLAVGAEGPGGCAGQDRCKEYCDNISHIDECISFAEENNLIPPEELEEAKKVQAAIRRGVNPPACGNKRACDVYCEEPEHMEECVSFAEAAGFLQGKELEDAQKMLQAVKRGVKPPPCRGKETCDEYCSSPDNMEVCMTFAIEAGFMTEQEKADSQKMLEALRKGVKPPNCRGKEECDVYCSEDEHFEECINFAEAAGFMAPEQVEMARKTGGKGPGGCKREECEAFCNNPDNQETCFNFAKEHGLIPEEDLKMMEEGKQRFKESLEQAPAEVIDCLNSQFGTEMMEKFKTGAVMPPKEIGDQMRECFEKIGPMKPMEGQEFVPGTMPEGQAGPGGCKTPEECNSYCQTNPEECKGFQPFPAGPEGTGGPLPGFNEFQPGPNICNSPEECQNFQQPFMPNGPEGQFPNTGEFQPPINQTCQNPEECRQIMPQPFCEGESCQTQPIQPGEFQPPPGQQQWQPPEQNFIAPQQTEQEFRLQPIQEILEQQPAPTESQPSSFFNANSPVGSLIYILFKFLSN